MRSPVSHRTVLAGVALFAVVSLSGGWMLFDGLHALVTGSYVTPATGPHRGQLGPWAHLISAAGLRPDSIGVRLIFVGYGAAYLTALVAFLLKRTRGPRVVLQVVAVLGLWYIPFGTLLNVIAIALLRFGPLGPGHRAASASAQAPTSEV